MTKQPSDPQNKSSGSDQKSLGSKIPTRPILKDQVLILSGPAGIFRLNKSRIVIGSVVSADVRLGGEAVAPIHAVIEMPGFQTGAEPWTVSDVMIYDLASETGLFVNGQKVIAGALHSGDKVAIGSYLLTVSLSDFDSLQKEVPKNEVVYTSGPATQGGGKPLLLSPQEDLGSLLLEDERDVEPIFDYRPARKQALEVVMSWKGTILDVEHFVGERSVRIGESRKNDFGIPSLITTKKGSFTLVERKRGNPILHLDPKMRGVIQRRGKLDRIEKLTHEIELNEEDFAKVSIGDIDFYLSFTAAPPRLKLARPWEKDPLFLRIFLLSMALTALMIKMLYFSQVPQLVEAEKIPERMATILYNPEKYLHKEQEKPEIPLTKPTQPQISPEQKTPEPVKTIRVEVKPVEKKVPQVVPREMEMKQEKPLAPKKAQKSTSSQKSTSLAHQAQNEAREGAGARAKGKEGVRGQPHAPKDVIHQDKAVRPGPQGGQGSGGGNSQVQGIGNVDLLNTATAKITDILGNGADRLGKGGEKLKGFGAFTTQGSGGLALSGNGAGGGGTADTTLGGLADHGTGGGRVGTGKGAVGNGSGIVGGKVRVAIRTGGSEEGFVMGSIDKDAIAAAMQAHYDEFRLCYEKEVNAESPNLAGRVSTTFVIGSTGRVTQAGIESTTLKNANTERCILEVIRRIAFPIPRGAGIVQVSYPFKFNRANPR